MSEHYDVIIIGTGAGGGTLAHRLAPSGKRILLLERGGYLPREPENWDSRGGLPQGALPVRRGLDRQGRQRVPPAPAVLRRRQHEVLRRDPVPAARARLRRGRATTAASRRRGRSPTHDLEPYYARGRGALPRARPGGRGPDRAARARRPFPYPAVSHEPRIQQLADDFARTGHQPVPPAGRRRPERVRSRGGPLRALRPLRRLPVPRPTARPTRTCAASGRRSSTPNVTLRTHAKVERLETDADRAHGDRGGRRPQAARARRYSADIVVVSCGAVNSAALLLRSANDAAPERARELAPTSSGATTWPTSTRA